MNWPICVCFDPSCRRSETLWCVGNTVQRLPFFFEKFYLSMKTNYTASRMWNHSVAFYKMHNTKEYLHITFKAGLRKQRLRVSRIEFQVETVNLPLSGTVRTYMYIHCSSFSGVLSSWSLWWLFNICTWSRRSVWCEWSLRICGNNNW